MTDMESRLLLSTIELKEQEITELKKKCELLKSKLNKDKITEKIQKSVKLTEGEDDGGGDSGGGGGGDAEVSGGIDEDVEKAIDEINQQRVDIQTRPKDLILNDGTETGMNLDSTKQTEPIDKMDDEYEIIFENGSWDKFIDSAQDYSKKVTLVRQTITPLIDKAFIELLENSKAFKRKSFDVATAYKDGAFRLTAEYVYHVDLFIGTEFEPSQVKHDQDYIYNTVALVPGISISKTQIDTDTGDITIMLSV